MYLYADVRLQLWRETWRCLIECDRYKRLRLRHQRRRGGLAQPTVHDVGIDAVTAPRQLQTRRFVGTLA